MVFALNTLLQSHCWTSPHRYTIFSTTEYCFPAVFIDLRKAFDTVSHQRPLVKLEHYGIRGIALQLMKSYPTDRKQFVNINGVCSNLKTISIVVHQAQS